MNGQISAVFGKLAALHAKNNFAFAIVAGNLFAAPSVDDKSDQDIQQLLNGKITIPLPTYFALGSNLLPDRVVERLQANSGELCPNLYLLGRRTTVKTSEGIKIVALGGAYEGDVIKEKTSLNEYSPASSYEDVKILKGANAADIVVTNEWPAAIRTGSRVAVNEEDLPQGQQGIADLCSWLKPRYHFSTSGVFFEREPFFHAQEEGAEGFQVTRFISLASYGNPSKQKWIYAFSLDPKAAPPVTIPTGVTASPLAFATKKRKEPASNANSNSNYRNGDSHHHRGKRARAPPPTPKECFFCLSNPNIASQLITSIGDNAYLTTAKGPLSTSSTFPALGFPSHMLIIPLEHSPTISAIPDPESRQATLTEMQRYRTALQTMLSSRLSSSASEGKEAQKLGAVTWEISRAGGIHIHWQFLPVPLDLIQRGLVEAAFKVEAENEHYPAFQTLKSSNSGNGNSSSSAAATEAEGTEDYFKATIWAGEEGQEKTMVLYLDSSFRFDLQFGRRVLAKLLGLESRLHWQDCAQTEAEETADAEAFKGAFKEFDFSLEE